MPAPPHVRHHYGRLMSVFLIFRDPLVVAALQEHPLCPVPQVRALEGKAEGLVMGGGACCQRVLEGGHCCRAKAYQPLLPEQHIFHWAFRGQESLDDANLLLFSDAAA